MATIGVRQLDDDVVRRLRQRAASHNRSLQREVRHILEGTVEDDMTARRESFLALIARLRCLTEGRAHTPSEVLIREDRDHGHRAI